MSASEPDQGLARHYGYYRDLLRGRRMPLAFVDLDLFDANAAALIARAGGKRVRVASKSLRCVGLLQRVLASHGGFRGVLCFSGWEAVFLASRGIDDLVVAYPLWNQEELAALCEQVSRGGRLVLMVDSPAQVERVAGVAQRAGVVMPLCLDLDLASDYPGLHFGVWRSPVRSPAHALALAEAVSARPSVRLEGLMGYEAQIAGLPDRGGNPLRAALVRLLKRRSRREVARRRAGVVEALRASGHVLRFVNGGGTGSVESTRGEECVTEIAAGSALFAPALFDGYERFRHLPAAGFAIEITRQPRPHIFTCHGGGYVASGAAGSDRLPLPYLPAGARLLASEGAGEVQTPIRYRGEQPLEPGDPILMRHAKAGELCERFPSLLLIADGQVVGEAATYRGEGECFL